MYDLHNKILLNEKLDARSFSIKGLGVVFDGKVDLGLFEKFPKLFIIAF